MGRVLKRDFFERSAEIVARELIGKTLVRDLGEGAESRFVITETEAYLGEEDKASHARFGPTKRNAPMYGEPGTVYVYLIYGMHYMFNIVCQRRGVPHAVLVRALDELEGPGRLCRKLKIDASLNFAELSKQSGIYVVDERRSVNILRAPRVGVDYAEEWKDKKLRFVINDNGAK